MYPQEKEMFKVTFSRKIGFISEKYFDIDKLKINLVEMKVDDNTKINYPQAFRYLFEKDNKQKS
jgi:hypothetical protein